MKKLKKLLLSSLTMTLPFFSYPALADDKTVEIAGPSGPLQASLSTPEAKPQAVVVIIPGSGPTDRDGNGPLIQTNVYKLLAEGLSSQHIASLRIDKRGMFGSKAAIANPNQVTISDYAEDVRRWAQFARQQTGLPCAWVLGHSEGGLVALTVPPSADVCGLILVSTAGRPLGSVLREQLHANPANAPLLADADRILNALEQKKPVAQADIPAPLLPLFHPVVQDFLISEMQLDPARLIAAVTQPVLIVQGDQDLQVKLTDANLLKATKTDAGLTVLKNTNHVLKNVSPGDMAANMKSYRDPQSPLSDGLISSISNFISAHPVQKTTAQAKP